MLRAADRGEVTLLCLLDLSAAFDTVDHDILLERLQMSFGVHGTVLSWLESFLHGRTQSVSVSGKSSDRLSLTLGSILFLIYCADVTAIAKRHGLGVHSYADDTQLYFYTAPATVDNKMQRLVVCVEEIHQWMNTNRLRLNEDKTQFIWLGTPH